MKNLKLNPKATKHSLNLNSKFQNLTSDHRGITLIALIITVIILLILSALTIDVAVDGKLFDRTKDAVAKTNNKTTQEENDVNTILGWLDNEMGDDTQCNHVYGDWEITNEATCTVTGTKKATCTKCGKEIIENIVATGHSYGEWVITKAATCTEPGLKTKTCTKCGDVISEVIPNDGHKFTDGVCTECGEEDHQNSVPIVTSAALNSKTTSSFIVDAIATDEDGDTLTYSLYVSGSNEAADTKTVSQGETVQLTASNLSEYTDYTYYVAVTDNTDNVQTDTLSVKTKCSGQTTTCTTNECTTGYVKDCSYCSGGWTTCSTCDGTLKVKCGTCEGAGIINCPNMSMENDGQTFNITCPTCGNAMVQSLSKSCRACGATSYTEQCAYYDTSTRESCSYFYTTSTPHTQVSCTANCNSGYVDCSSCNGGTQNCTNGCTNGSFTSICSHKLSQSHRYCDHYTNTTITSHKICDHSTSGAEHE